MKKITASAVIIRNGSVPGAYSNTKIDPIAFDFTINNSFDTTIFIALDTLLANDSIKIVFTRPIDICNYTYDELTFKADINSQKHLLETTFNDNHSTSSVYKQSIYVNGNMENGEEDTIFGWKAVVDSGQNVRFRWDRPGERISTSRTISISSIGITHAEWVHPVNVQRGKTYIVSGWVRGDNIDQKDTLWPSISIGFEGTGFLCPIRKTGSFGWTYFCSTIKASDVLTDFALACRLGFYSIGTQDNGASGTVTFDDIKLETY